METDKTIKVVQMETLESEIKKFAEALPYWAKYLAHKILSGIDVYDDDIDKAYSYLLEKLNIDNQTQKLDITINCESTDIDKYKNE